MINKLKIVKSVTLYSTENSWHTYRDIISPLKSKIINGEIEVDKVRYGDDAFKTNLGGLDIPIFDGKEVIGNESVYGIFRRNV